MGNIQKHKSEKAVLRTEPEPKAEEPKWNFLPEPEPKSRIAAPAPFYLPQTGFEVFVNCYNFNPIA